MNSLDTALAALGRLKQDPYGKDLLLTWERTDDDILALAAVAEALSDLHRAGRPLRAFESGLAISIFRDQSTRTRFSFAAAANALGLGLADLDEEKSQIAHGETVRETAAMISFLAEAIGIRDDLYLGEGHAYQRRFAEAVTEAFEQGVLHQRPAIVNLQSDVDHPTQAMADLLALKAHFGSFEALRGRKLAMTWAYSPTYGKPLSVPQGVIALLTRFGMNVTLAHPEGYELIPEVLAVAREGAARGGGRFAVTASMDEAFAGADAVYPKSWAPYRVMERRTVLLKQGDRDGLKALERECLAANARFRSWECTESRMRATRNALYLHCLPADISGVSCAEGEVAAEVFERFRLATYRQAAFKPFVIAAAILLARKHGVDGTLRRLGGARP